jgi:hypothetical protein
MLTSSDDQYRVAKKSSFLQLVAKQLRKIQGGGCLITKSCWREEMDVTMERLSRSGSGIVGKEMKVRDEVVAVLNPLNAELNPICHLLELLEDLTFMGPCIVNIFQYTCISNKMQRYTVYLYLETALHVSGGNSTHHQELIQLYVQHLVFVTPLLLSAAIVEELEPV